VEKTGAMSTIIVRRVGSMPIPVHMKITLQGGETKDIVKTADMWKDGGEELRFRVDHDTPITSVRIGARWVPDANPSDNTWTR